jgi:hypothetical protein
MQLSQLRTQTRRYVQDVAAVEWTDDEIDLVINDSYYDLQSELQMVAPEAVIAWDTIDAKAENWYPKPPTFGIIQVGLKKTGDTTFTKLALKDYNDIKDLTGTDTFYCERGDWIGIFPAPDVVTDGVEVMHRPIDTLVEDTDIPKLKLPLHQAICLQAKVFLLGDTNENGDRDEAKLTKIKEKMPLMYMGNIDQQILFSPRGL